MLISEKTKGSIYFFLASKEAYPIVRQLENIMVKKSASQSSKMREKTNVGSPGTLPGHLSVNA